MASLSAHPSPCATSMATISILPKYSHYSFIHKTCQTISRPKNRNPNYKPVISQARPNGEQSPSRRDLLIGLGGLYTAASNDPFALAAPILGPDLNQCQNSIMVSRKEVQERCCLIRSSEPKPFVLPRNPKVVVRQAAHLADEEYYKMFEEAIRIMKSLPDDDPRSFMNQAKIHCSYCNNAYVQPDGSQVPFQVHDSALFFPFHRWYLYFFERICGDLIGNPDFRLPFWNWDVPEGKTMPEPYTRNKDSPLYNASRIADHTPTRTSPTLSLQVPNVTPTQVPSVEIRTIANLGSIKNAMVRNSKTPESFLGPIYGAGVTPLTQDEGGSGGQIESGPHTALHIWVGGDMGSFDTAGRDPLFYAHHANVDRMWNIWKSGKMPGCGKRRDFTDRDWLDTEFIFYDENGKMVTVTVEGCLDSAKLGYEFQDVSIKPWVDCRFTPRRKTPKPKGNRGKSKPLPVIIRSPIKLDKVVEFIVNRPRTGKRSTEEKAKKDEVLVVQNIISSGAEKYIKFDVLINDDDLYNNTTPVNSEFAGSFAVLEPAGGGPMHQHGGKGMMMKNKMTRMKKRGANLILALTEILEELNAENDESIKVTLVPRIGCGSVTIGGIKVDYRNIS